MWCDVCKRLLAADEPVWHVQTGHTHGEDIYGNVINPLGTYSTGNVCRQCCEHKGTNRDFINGEFRTRPWLHDREMSGNRRSHAINAGGQCIGQVGGAFRCISSVVGDVSGALGGVNPATCRDRHRRGAPALIAANAFIRSAQTRDFVLPHAGKELIGSASSAGETRGGACGHAAAG